VSGKSRSYLATEMKLKLAASAEVPKSVCPACSAPYDRAAALNEPGIFRVPEGGDTTVCRRCLSWLVFRDDLSARVMSSKEVSSLTTEERETLVELTRAIHRVNELSASRPKMR
jgi:hypothetical protein